jgi:serine/threonine protein kinase
LAGKDLDDTQDLPHQYRSAESSNDGDELPAGAAVGAYTIVDKIASGGGGTVYEAQGPSGERVAIKVLLRELAASAQALGRFRREADVVARLHHPNIVRSFDAAALPDGHPYIVMELVARDSLRTVIQERGRLSPDEMLAVLRPTCSALAVAHGAGVVHRDLKASNISVGGPPEDPVIKLLDFGIAKLTQVDPSAPGLTVQGSRLGTPYAMAPEQIRGDLVDQRADIYALGVLVYQMLTGTYPFTASSPREIERLHLEAIPPRPSRLAPVSPALEAVVLRCLEKRPDQRFPSVTEMMAAVEAAMVNQEAPPVRIRQAVAISVEACGAGEDEALEIVDVAEASLREEGFAVPLGLATSVLGVYLLPEGAEVERAERQRALEVARALAVRLGPSARVTLHAGPAQVSGAEVTGGEVLDIASWPPGRDAGGVSVTAAVTA